MQIQRGIGGGGELGGGGGGRGGGGGGSVPNDTMICALTADSDQPGAKGSCYTTLSAWGKLKVL